MVEEEKQEHMEKVKELLGWVSTLARNTQGTATSSHTSASTDIEKAILEQQVSGIIHWNNNSHGRFILKYYFRKG